MKSADNHDKSLGEARRDAESYRRAYHQANSTIERNRLELDKLKNDRGELLDHLTAMNRNLSELAGTKPYRISNFMRRFSHEMVHGGMSGRKSFIKWVARKILRRPEAQKNPYNLINQIVESNQDLINRLNNPDLQPQKSVHLIDYESLTEFEKKLHDEIQYVLRSFEGQQILLQLSDRDWYTEDINHHQRLLLELGQSGCLCFFVTCNIGDQIDVMQSVGKNCHVINANNELKLVIDLIHQAGKKVTAKIDSSDNLHGVSFIKSLRKKADLIIYDYELPAETVFGDEQARKAAADRHAFIIKSKSIEIVTTDEDLYSATLKARGDVNLHLLRPSDGSDQINAKTPDLDKSAQLLAIIEERLRPKIPFIMLSIIDWNFRFQRPQHLARILAENGHPVYYFNANFAAENKIETVRKNVTSITLNGQSIDNIYSLKQAAADKTLYVSVIECLRELQLTEAVVMVEYPTWEPVAARLKREFGYRLVFDYLDEYDGFEATNSNQELAKAAASLCRASDLVVATSSYLYEKVSKQNANTIIVRNGTEFDHFHKAFHKDVDSAKTSAQSGRKIIGYYGAIADWFAIDLMVQAASNLPEYDFELVGDYSHADVKALSALSNVKLLGEKPYADLVKILKRFDVCLIPFNSSLDLIKATNPVKFYEYLSAGKKIVATEIPELAEYKDKYVLMSNDPEQFSDYIRQCVENRDSLLPAEQLSQFAQGHDWFHRVSMIEQAAFSLYPLVSVIIVTYNNLSYTRMCLGSILDKTTYPNFELIIVDNNSTDETPDYLSRLQLTHKNIKVQLNQENTGFAKANNIGIKLAKGEMLVLLNNDTILPPGWINSLVKHLRKKEYGMVGPVTNNIGNEAMIPVTYRDASGIDEFASERLYTKLNRVFDINVLAMFCVAFKRELIEKIGYLDESFGIGMFEDDDFSERVRGAGLRVVCCDDAFIHHFGGASFKLLDSEVYKEIFEKNKEIYEQKHQKKYVRHKPRK